MLGTAGVIACQQGFNFLRRHVVMLLQPLADQRGKTVKRDTVGGVGIRKNPVRERHEAGKRCIAQHHRQRIRKTAGVRHHVPVTRKTHQTLHVSERNVAVFQNRVRRLRIETQRVFIGMADDRRAAQTLQNTELNFMRPDCDQMIKAFTKTFHGFTRQTGNQIHM